MKLLGSIKNKIAKDKKNATKVVKNMSNKYS